MSEARVGQGSRVLALRAAGVVATLLLSLAAASAAEPSYPFEGTWIRAEHSCTPATVRARIYTAKEVVSPLGRCTIRRVTAGANTFELLEECRRNDRQQTVTETIRLATPDAMTSRRQLSRLKIPRQVRYTRCSIAAAPAAAHRPPAPTGPRAPAPALPGPAKPK